MQAAAGAHGARRGWLGRHAGHAARGVACLALACGAFSGLRAAPCRGGARRCFAGPQEPRRQGRRAPPPAVRFFGDLFGGDQEEKAPPPADPNTPFEGGMHAPVGFDAEGSPLQILRYPHPALRAQNAQVEVFDVRLRHLCNNLFNAMYDAGDGIGLAAPQVGVNLRLMVYNPNPGNPDEETVFVNPRIVNTANGMTVEQESCLSFPRMRGPVQRPAWIEVEAAGWDGCPFRRTIDGFEARLFQHEYDHLDGVLYVDRLPEPSRIGIQPDLDFLVKDYVESGGADPAP